MSATTFIEARDFLLAHRRDYETAYRDFRWPVLDRAAAEHAIRDLREQMRKLLGDR